MRVAFVCNALRVGGAERFLVGLMRQLPSRGVDAFVLALNDRGRFFDELLAGGLDARFAEVRSRYDVPRILQAVSMVRAERPDLVLSQSVDANIIGHVAARTTSVPHIAIEHQQPELRPAAHRRALLRLVAPRVDAVVAVTGAQRAMLEGAGYRPEAVRVIPNGVPRPSVTRSRQDVRAELGVAEDEAVALLVATLRPEKDPLVFVDAVAEARRGGCRVRGVVAGTGSERARVEERAGAVGGVTVLGERTDVADLMAASDVVCLSSRAEALPMVVLEAMAVGRPILATRVGGLEEVVSPSVGTLVAPGSSQFFAQALSDLVGDPVGLQRMGDEALRRYEELYTLDRMVDAYVRLMSDVAGKPEGSPSAAPATGVG